MGGVPGTWHLWEVDCILAFERCHRVSYMAAHEILRADMPCTNDDGKKLEVSHLCHNGICVNPAHLVLQFGKNIW